MSVRKGWTFPKFLGLIVGFLLKKEALGSYRLMERDASQILMLAYINTGHPPRSLHATSRSTKI